MQNKHFTKAALLALVLLSGFCISWEAYWRSEGFTPTYNDDKMLWATKRALAYLPKEDATIFIGSSRIKFDLDIPTWKEATGEEPVQLALVGTSPILLLKDLAADEAFKGKLVVDITEPIFFSQAPFFHKSSKEATEYYHKQTPSEKLSSLLGYAVESKLVLLEERKFSLNELLNDLQLPNRPGAFSMPAFPKSFELNTIDRQTYMPDMFLNDSNQINRQTAIWSMLIGAGGPPPISGKELENFLQDLKKDVDRIKARGGDVIFVRTPSSGPMGHGEQMGFPREKYWEAVLSATGSDGIHFLDNPNTANLICPEWSHLSPKDAITYTLALVQELKARNWFSQPVP